jgi:hypothetical protein
MRTRLVPNVVSYQHKQQGMGWPSGHGVLEHVYNVYPLEWMTDDGGQDLIGALN